MKYISLAASPRPDGYDSGFRFSDFEFRIFILQEITSKPRPSFAAQTLLGSIAPVIGALFATALSSLPFSARATVETWHPGGAGGGNGTWNTGVTANWNFHQTWTNGNDALFSGAGGTITVVNPGADALTFAASGPYLLYGGTLTLTGTGVDADGDTSTVVTVNSAATFAGTVDTLGDLVKLGGATLAVTGTSTIGENLVVDAGTVGVTGAGSITADTELSIGESGAGTFAVSGGGTVSDGAGYAGNNAGSLGAVTVTGSGSTWTNDSDLYIGNSGTGTLTISGGGAISNGENNIGATIGEVAGGSGTVTVTGGGSSWMENGNLYVGDSGAGALTISNGGAVTCGVVGDYYGPTIGNNTGSSGAVTVTGSGSLWTVYEDLYVGYSGTGMLTISSGGTVSNGQFYIGATIGEVAGGSGAVTVTGGGSAWMDSGDLYVGDSGTGALTISNGGVVTNSGANIGATIGEVAGSGGTVTVTGSGSMWMDNSDLYVGDSGSGSLTISNGGAVTNGQSIVGASIGQMAGAAGTVIVTGSGAAWLDSGDLYVGDSGTGTLAISNGGTVTNAQTNIGASIGEMAGAAGTVTVSGSGATWSDSGDLYIGDFGTGTLTISAGGMVSNSSVSGTFGAAIGNQAGSIGTVTVTGSGSTWTDSIDLYVGDSGTGTLTISNGGSVIGRDAFVAGNPGSTGAVMVTGSGSKWTENDNLYVGDSGRGTLTISNGGSVTSGNAYISGNPGASGASAAVTVTGSGSTWTDGGDLFVGDLGAGTLLSASGGAVDAGDLFVGGAGGGTLAISAAGAVSDSGGVVGNIAGCSGTATVSGAGSIWRNGSLEVGGAGNGTLLISGGGAISDNGSDFIGADGGSGLVTVSGSGSAWNSGALSVGDSGTGALVISAGATVADSYGYIGQSGSGTATVSGSGSTWANSEELDVADSGSGSLVISGGGGVTDYNALIAADAGSTGMAIVTGTGSIWTNSGNLRIGGSYYNAGGAGVLRITGGGAVNSLYTTVWSTGVLAFGENAALGGDLEVSGGTLTLADGQLQTVTFTSPVTIDPGSTLGFDVGKGSDQLAFSGSGSFTFTGAAAVNLYVLSGQATSGTDVLIAAPTSGELSLGAVYNSGNFTYSLLSTATSAEVVVTAAATPLTTAYWTGAQGNVWSIVAGGTATNWSTSQAGTTDPHLTPSATTDVIFSANSPSNEGGTVLGTSMTVHSLTISDTNALVISGSDLNPWMGTGTLTISGSSGTTGLTVNPGAGPVEIGANVYLSGTSQNVIIENAAGLLLSGSMAGSYGLYIGGNSSGPAGAGLVTIATGGSVSATQTTVWDSGTLALGENAILSSPLVVNGGTLSLADGQMQTFTFTKPVTIDAGSTLDLDAGNGPAQVTLSGAGVFNVTGAARINLYVLSAPATSGTEVLIAASTSGHFSLGNVYNAGNFTYSLESTGTSEDVVALAAASPLTTAYWKGGQDNVWSVLVGGTATNWATNAAGTLDPLLTPSATTDVIFSAGGAANEGGTVLDADMTIKSLTISDPKAVVISGSNPNPIAGTNTLTVADATGAAGINVGGGAGAVTIGANLYFSGSSQDISVDNAGGLLITGSFGGSNGLIKSGTGALTLTGPANFSASALTSTNGGIDDTTVDGEFGTLNIAGGSTVSDEYGEVGGNAGSDCLVTVSGSGSSWTNGNSLVVGESGTGSLRIGNGAIVSDRGGPINSEEDVLGDAAGSLGTVTVSGAGSAWTDSGDLRVGNYGTGTLTISTGGSVTNGVTTEGALIGVYSTAGGTVTVTGSGSSWTDLGDLFVGESGSGTLTISNGGTVSNESVYYGATIADSYFSTGTVTVTGTGSAWSDYGDLYVGGGGTGTLTISNGATVSNSLTPATFGSFIGGAAIGYAGSGVAMVTGAGSIWTDGGDLYVGYLGEGTLMISGGGAVTNGYANFGAALGGDSSSSGAVTVTGSGSIWTDAGDLYVGESGSGTLTISGGGAVTNAAYVLGGAAIGYAASTSIYYPGSTGAVTVTGSGSTWTDSGDLYVGDSGTGTLTISSGGKVTSGFYTLGAAVGYAAGSMGSVTVSGSGSTWTSAAHLTVGDSGKGVLAISSGGAVSDSAGYLGVNAGAYGGATLSGTGSSWSNTNNLVAGYLGAGTLAISGGGSAYAAAGYIAYGVGSTGTATVSGIGSKWAITQDAYIADSGKAALAITGGGGVSDFRGYIGVGAGSNGAATLSGTGSSWKNTSNFVAGFFGAGALTSSSGAAISDSNGYIGYGAGGTVVISGSGTDWTNIVDLHAGVFARGTLAISGGAIVSDFSGYLGSYAGAYGGVAVSGTGSAWKNANNVAIGYSGAGALTVSGGGAFSGANNYIGLNAGSTGVVTVSGSGSSWSASGVLALGDAGTGTLILEGGALATVTGATVIGGSGTLEFDGGSTFNTGSLAINGGTLVTLGTAAFAPSASLGAGGVRVNTGGFNSIFSGRFSGAGGFTKAGSGVATLTGASIYAGATAVNTGTLAVTTAAGHTASLGNTAITVASGATFAATLGASPFSKMVNAGTTGSGSSGATLTLDPGSSFSMAGTSLATFNLQQENSFSGPAFTIGGASGIAPSLIFEIGNAATGTDLLHVTKTVSVLATGGDITIDALAGDTSLTAGNYDLIATAGGFSGTAGNRLVLSGTTLAISGSTYDLSLAESTTNTEILTVSDASTPSTKSTPSTPSTPSSSLTAFDASTPDLAAGTAAAPLIQTASVPEPSAAASLLTASALAAASLLRRSRRGSVPTPLRQQAVPVRASREAL